MGVKYLYSGGPPEDAHGSGSTLRDAREKLPLREAPGLGKAVAPSLQSDTAEEAGRTSWGPHPPVLDEG